MRFLFVKTSLTWPRSSGHEIHSYHIMKALAQLGHELALATVGPLQSEAVAGLPLEMCRTLREYDSDQAPSPLTGLAERYRSYWGIPCGRIAAVSRIAEEFRAARWWPSGSTYSRIWAEFEGPLEYGTQETSGYGITCRRFASATVRCGRTCEKQP